MKRVFLLMSGILFSFMIYAQQPLLLENSNLLAEFNPSDGSLIRLISKKNDWKVMNRAELGQSFEMLIPLKERRLHLVKGSDQIPPQIQKKNNRILFTWKSIRSKWVNSPLNLSFSGSVELTDNGLIYSGVLDNRSGYTIEYIAWPFLGEITVPDKSKSFVSQTRNGIKNLFPAFHSEHGYWGVEYPTQIDIFPESSFMLLRNENQGIYASSEQFYPSQMVLCSNELIPGYEILNKNPLGDEMDGQMVRIQFKANHIVYAHDKTKTELKPFVLIPYKGDWQKGVAIYKDWKNPQVKKISSPEWISQPYTWQKINVSNGQDLINYAQKARKQGVSVLHARGWVRNGNGSHIGTIDDLDNAIKTCRDMGVQVVLETNFTQVDFRSDGYSSELKNYTITDPFGIVYDRSIVCPFVERVQTVVKEELAANSAVLAANGAIIDDNNHRNKTYFCFNPNHGHTVPEYIDKGTIQMDETFAIATKTNDRSFATLGFGLYDCQTAYYDGYQINSSMSSSPVQRYINPEEPIISTVDVRTARRDMNLCLKNRYNICYDLQFYSHELSTYPHIMEYGKQIETLRNRYKNYIWDAEFQDVLRASVSGEHISYAVYIGKSDRKKAIVVVNQSATQSTIVKASIPNSSTNLWMATPENPESSVWKGSVELAPQSVVVIMEK
jgi:hypothetical protein